jgi:MFS family permease
MSFKKALSNKSINALNLHYGLQMFANNIGEVFSGVFLYKAGLPLWGVFLALAGIFTVRLMIRPLGMVLCRKIGLKLMIQWGTLTFALLFMVLMNVSGLDAWLIGYILLAAVVDVLYWLPYHTYFALLGDVEDRGKQIGIRSGLTYLASLGAPFLGGVLIEWHGFGTAFVVASIIMAGAVFPLLGIDDIPLKSPGHWKKAWKETNKKGFLLYAGWGFHYYAHIFCWTLVLFLLLKDYVYFGGLLSLAVLFKIVGMFVVGNLFDQGKWKHMYLVGAIIMALVIVGRSTLAFTIPVIIAFDLLFMIGDTLFAPVGDAVYYNMVKNERLPLWVQFFAESGWDVAAISASLMGAGILYTGGSLRLVMLPSVLGVLGMAIFLKNHYHAGDQTLSNEIHVKP